MGLWSRSRFGLASTVAHLSALAALRLLPPYQGPADARVIQVAIQHRAVAPRPPEPVLRPMPPPAAAPQRRETDRERSREQRPPAPAPPGVTPPGPPTSGPPAAPIPAEPSGPSTPRKIDLFDPLALQNVMPASAPGGIAVGKSGWGGTTRRAGDGLPVPGARDASADREEAASKIHGWFDDTTGEMRAQAGQVPPKWREAERKINAIFFPTHEMVSNDGIGRTWLNQMVNNKPESGATPRGVDDSADRSRDMAQALQGQASMNRAVGWTRVEIEVVLDDQGNILSSKILERSGHKKFDAAALEAVVKALDHQGAIEEKGAVITRWRVEASMAVAGPTSLGLSFDESTGKASLNHPMKKEVATRVRLLSVKPRRPGAG